MPMDTMSPVIPARSKLGLKVVCPRAEMMAHSSAAVRARPEMTTRPRPR